MERLRALERRALGMERDSVSACAFVVPAARRGGSGRLCGERDFCKVLAGEEAEARPTEVLAGENEVGQRAVRHKYDSQLYRSLSTNYPNFFANQKNNC